MEWFVYFQKKKKKEATITCIRNAYHDLSDDATSLKRESYYILSTSHILIYISNNLYCYLYNSCDL